MFRHPERPEGFPHALYTYTFQSPSDHQVPFAPFSDWRTSRRRDIRLRLDLDDLPESWRNAMVQTKADRPPALPLVLENLAFLLFSPSWPDQDAERFFEGLSEKMHFVWFPALLLALILAARATANGDHRHALPLLAALLLWLIFQGFLLIIVNEARYRKPAEGMIIASILLGASRYKRGKAGAPPGTAPTETSA